MRMIIFGLKEHVDLMMALEVKIRDNHSYHNSVSELHFSVLNLSVHCLETLNVYTK